MAIEAAVLPLMPPESLLGWPYRDIYFVGNRRHEGFGVVAFRAFERPRIETRPFRLDDPQGHHRSAFWASRALDTVYEHCVSPIGRNDCPTFVGCRGARTIAIALRKSFVRKVTDVCAVITNVLIARSGCAGLDNPHLPPLAGRGVPRIAPRSSSRSQDNRECPRHPSIA
jgi:hypothetical protein